MEKNVQYNQITNIENLEKKYIKLPEEDKIVVHFSTLLYTPVWKKIFINYIQKILLNQFSKKYTQTYIKEIIKRLEEDGIMLTSPNGVTVNKDLQLILLRKYIKDAPSLQKMLDYIHEGNIFKNKDYFYSIKEQFANTFREIRNALYLDLEYNRNNIFFGEDEIFSIKLEILANDFSSVLLKRITSGIPENQQMDILIAVIHKITIDMQPTEKVVNYLSEQLNQHKNIPYHTIYNTLLIYLIQGRLEEFETLYKKKKLPTMPFGYFKAISTFMKGDLKRSKHIFEDAIANDPNYHPKRVFAPTGIFGVFYILNLIALLPKEGGDVASILKIANKSVKNNKQNSTPGQLLQVICYFLSGDEKRASKSLHKIYSSIPQTDSLNVFSILLLLLTLSIIKVNTTFYVPFIDDYILKALQRAYENNYTFTLHQMINLLPKVNERQQTDLKISKTFQNAKKSQEEKGIKYIDYSNIIKLEEPWRVVLKGLIKIGSASEKNLQHEQKRVAWLFWHHEHIYDSTFGISVHPLEQKILKNGKWSKGKVASLKRVVNKELPGMSDLDYQIADTIMQKNYYYDDYQFQLEKTLPLLAKHPALFLDDHNRTPLELVEEPPQFVVLENKKGYSVSLSHNIDINEKFSIRRETATRYSFTVFNNKVLQIANIIEREKNITIPKTGEKLLRSALESMTSIMPVHSNAKKLHSNTGEESKIKYIEASPKIHIHLLPVGDTVRVELFVRPFGSSGPFYKPGNGATVIMTDIDGSPAETRRDLRKEEENAVNILEKCPSLAIRGDYDEIFSFDSTHECLEFLMEVDNIFSDIVIEWPEGGKLSINRMCGLKDIEFGITSKIDWFELEGSLKLDESKVIAINDLIRQASQSRFIELGKGEFIAITDKLRDRLTSISAFGTEKKDKLKVHSLNVHQIDLLLEDAENFKPGKKWREKVKKVKDLEKFIPEIPSTLCADLRPYQSEGIKWLARLAEWGVGACLADDMGLGKTIQALGVLLSRASQGPSLVVAPSSVCSNWVLEARKFAPTLKPALYRESDRASVLKNLAPFDLLIVSYGLLASEQDSFGDVEWSNVVLDEAQYIKNHRAKRTRAAFGLKGDMRIITTGTPVENHLAELWTLFNFINPGMLGSKTEFDARFAIPIEKNGDKQASRDLRKVIQPFILRRIKSEVLEELPPKTEINLTVELSDEERGFYENIRQESIRNLESAKSAKGGTAHLMILTELTKLRLASCAPVLVSEGIKMKSSKLEMLGTIIQELKENNHKALVFSQFVKHLSIIRDFCDKNSISYQYLDGSTPPKKRAARVEAFQNGEGDLFLISLKAGGTGLNLTAADYVIHMDPWWNPAVEDQASDRTHRIGQERPVTVYRMVAKDTVEEKIIKLHKTKRELADTLLSGTDASAKMSLNDLMSIITDTV